MTNKHQILIVDDDPDIREALGIILEGNGYGVTKATCAKEALAAIDQQTPDVIILDVMMTTDTEGFDFAFELRNRPGCGNIPIFMLTSFLDKVREDGPDQYQHILGQQWPAKWIFEKPIPAEKLLKKLKAVLDS